MSYAITTPKAVAVSTARSVPVLFHPAPPVIPVTATRPPGVKADGVAETVNSTTLPDEPAVTRAVGVRVPEVVPE